MRALLLTLRCSGLWASPACKATLPVRLEGETFDILEDIRRSMGAANLFGNREGLTLRGVRAVPTQEGTSSRPITISAKPSGAFLLSVGGDAGSSTRGFDGADVWTRDTRGVVRRLGLGTRESVLLDGQLRTFLWLRPGSEELTVDVVERDSTADRIALDITHPTDPLSARAWVDRATMRLDSFELERLGRMREVRFEGWHQAGGLWLPHVVRESLDGELLHIDRFDTRSEGTPVTFAAPRSSLPSDTTFGGAVDRPVPLRSRVDPGGRFYVEARFGEDQAGWFLLDTGFGSHAIARESAASFGMTTSGSATLSGVGGTSKTAWQLASRVGVGPVDLADQRFATLDGSFLTARAGFEVHGVLGAPFFERLGVILDERSGSASIFHPYRYRPRGIGWHAVQLDGSAPCVQGTISIGGTRTPPLWFRLDTGSDDSLTVSQWAVNAHRLAGRGGPLRPTSLRGPFGELQGWRVRLSDLEFCGIRHREIESTLLREKLPGPLADPWIGGNLGMGALRGRRVIIDLPHGQIAVSGSGS